MIGAALLSAAVGACGAVERTAPATGATTPLEVTSFLVGDDLAAMLDGDAVLHALTPNPVLRYKSIGGPAGTFAAADVGDLDCAAVIVGDREEPTVAVQLGVCRFPTETLAAGWLKDQDIVIEPGTPGKPSTASGSIRTRDGDDLEVTLVHHGRLVAEVSSFGALAPAPRRAAAAALGRALASPLPGTRLEQTLPSPASLDSAGITVGSLSATVDGKDSERHAPLFGGDLRPEASESVHFFVVDPKAGLDTNASAFIESHQFADGPDAPAALTSLSSLWAEKGFEPGAVSSSITTADEGYVVVGDRTDVKGDDTATWAFLREGRIVQLIRMPGRREALVRAIAAHTTAVLDRPATE